MRPAGTMQDILFAVGDAEDTAIAFDFDQVSRFIRRLQQIAFVMNFCQTITLLDKTKPVGKRLSVRGGEASREALLALKAKGIPMFLITAQPPSVNLCPHSVLSIPIIQLPVLFLRLAR